MKPAARKLALMCGATVLSLAFAECAFRVHLAREEKGSDDAWRDNLRKMNATIYARSDDATLIYEPEPNSSVSMPYGVAGFSAQSMRDDREHAREPAPGKTRVALVGDSIVWGEDLPVGATLARALERELGDRYEVLNFGVTGYDTAQEAEWYRREVRAFRPAIVVLVYCLNDVFIASGPFNKWATPDELRAKDDQDTLVERLAPVREETIEDLSRREEEHAAFRLFARARTVWRVRRYEHDPAYTDEYLLLYGQKDKFDRVSAALRQLASDAKTDGAEAHLVISPMLRSWSTYHWSGIHDRVADAARAAGFVVHDPLATLRKSHREEEIRIDSLHFNAAGTSAVAAILARDLGKR
ncbi:MAG TPA: GDSL-type esterase/lipase family protein [Polyangiaceae bacterium]|nr:GDSL-type esterase/lipase family protein [Polyangiaceae bacterium]